MARNQETNTHFKKTRASHKISTTACRCKDFNCPTACNPNNGHIVVSKITPIGALRVTSSSRLTNLNNNHRTKLWENAVPGFVRRKVRDMAKPVSIRTSHPFGRRDRVQRSFPPSFWIERRGKLVAKWRFVDGCLGCELVNKSLGLEQTTYSSSAREDRGVREGASSSFVIPTPGEWEKLLGLPKCHCSVKAPSVPAGFSASRTGLHSVPSVDPQAHVSLAS